MKGWLQEHQRRFYGTMMLGFVCDFQVGIVVESCMSFSFVIMLLACTMWLRRRSRFYRGGKSPPPFVYSSVLNIPMPVHAAR